jgi:hypothetical protein
VTLRTTADLDGAAPDADAFEGALYPTLDQSILGYSHPCLEAATALQIKVLPGNTFKALRLDDLDSDKDGRVACAEVTAHRAELFPAPAK